MKTLIALAKNTFIETIRDRILLLILFFGILLVVAVQLLSALSIRQDEKIILDLGLGMIDGFGVLITLFLGTQLLFREVDTKTIFLLLSKPVTRTQFLFSKFLGLGSILLLISGIMLGVFLLLVALKTDFLWANNALNMSHLCDILVIALFSFLSFLLLLSLALFFSSFLPPLIASFSALLLFISGHITDDMRMFFADGESVFFKYFSEISYYVVPNFSVLNLKNFILHGISLSGGDLFWIFLGAVLWIFLLLWGAGMFFARKEF